MVLATHAEAPSPVAVMTPAAWKSLLKRLPARVRANLAWWPKQLHDDILVPLSRSTPQTLAAAEQSLSRVLLVDSMRLFPSLQLAFGGDMLRMNEIIEAELSERIAPLQGRATTRLGASSWHDLEWAMRVHVEFFRVVSSRFPAELVSEVAASEQVPDLDGDPLGRAVTALPLMVLGAASALDDDDIHFDDDLVREMCARAYDHATALQDGFLAHGIHIDPLARSTPVERTAHVRDTLHALAAGFTDEVRQAVADARITLQLGPR